MRESDYKTLIKYRCEEAIEALEDAELLIDILLSFLFLTKSLLKQASYPKNTQEPCIGLFTSGSRMITCHL